MYKKYFKNILDFGISLFGLIGLSPLLVLCYIVLSVLNKGSGAIFCQERKGKDDKVFNIIKFKTMNDAKDENGNLLSDSKRTTKFGNFLRLTSIDELLQLINILKGDMSLIGPRPLLVKDLPKVYTQKENLRHSVKPGITGLAQINGRTTLDWEAKLAFDVEYVKTLSFYNDMKIFFKTIIKVLLRKDIKLED